MSKLKDCIFSISEIRVNKKKLLSCAFPKLEFSQNTIFKFHKVVQTHYLGEVENIYNILWQIY